MRKLLCLIALCPGLLFAQSDLVNALIYQASIKAQSGGGGGGGNNIAFRSASFSGQGTANGVTMTEPSGAANNDVMFALALCGTASTSISPPSGWTSLYSGTQGAMRYNVAWIRRAGSAPALGWTMTTSAYREVYIVCYSGVTTTGNPYETSADGGGTTASNPDCPSVTTTTDHDFVLAIGANFQGATTTWTAPSGYTRRTDTTSGNDGVISDKNVSPAGAENPAAYTGGAGSGDCYQATVALKSS